MVLYTRTFPSLMRIIPKLDVDECGPERIYFKTTQCRSTEISPHLEKASAVSEQTEEHISLLSSSKKDKKAQMQIG